MTTFKKQYINEVSKIFTDETSMTKKMCQKRTCINFNSCEFHQTNNLEKFYTNEFSKA
ncbi:hypothetical protein SAMN05444380_11778 [Thermophagus xiamenensis]|uniref:Uncharacterized protein n=1 Tax=Thermophagus xiamenensis TaxID=385682 RepID=A0A1I2D1D4_9BACT|nr:hypothetical protein SAMN05444380_11778 [Thermophagus xiamenensis]